MEAWTNISDNLKDCEAREGSKAKAKNNQFLWWGCFEIQKQSSYESHDKSAKQHNGPRRVFAAAIMSVYVCNGTDLRIFADGLDQSFLEGSPLSKDIWGAGTAMEEETLDISLIRLVKLKFDFLQI